MNKPREWCFRQGRCDDTPFCLAHSGLIPEYVMLQMQAYYEACVMEKAHMKIAHYSRKES